MISCVHGIIILVVLFFGLLPSHSMQAALLPLGDLRDAGNNPWTPAIVKSGGGQTFTNLDALLPAFFLPGDTLNVSATSTGSFFASDPRLLLIAGVDYALWNHQSGVGSLTLSFSRTLFIEVQTHHDFIGGETVTLAGPGAGWTVINDDLDILADGLPIPGGNVSGSGTDVITIGGTGTVSAANNGFVVSPGVAINSFTWSYTSGSPNTAQGFALSIVPEPSTLFFGLSCLAFAITRLKRTRRSE